MPGAEMASAMRPILLRASGSRSGASTARKIGAVYTVRIATATDASLSVSKRSAQWTATRKASPMTWWRRCSTTRSGKRRTTSTSAGTVTAAMTQRQKTSAAAGRSTPAAITDTKPHDAAIPATARFHRSASHALGGFDSDEVEAAGDDALRRLGERKPEGFGFAFEHAMVMVEAVEVIGEADGVDRECVRAAPLGRLRDGLGELGEPLHEVALLRRELAGRLGRPLGRAGLLEDARDPRVRVLDVADGVLVRLLPGQVDVDLHGLLVARPHEVPPGGVDTDLVDELVEEDDVAASLRHLPGLSRLRQVHELVDQHVDGLRVVAECAREGPEARDVPVVVGA